MGGAEQNPVKKKKMMKKIAGTFIERIILMKSFVKTNAIKIGLLFVVVSTGCATHIVSSHWRQDGLTINGSEDEWPEVPQYYDSDRKVSLRMMNDADAVYLCFSTSDEALKKKLSMTGLTVWLDPAGEKHKTFGIHLPGAGPPGLPRKSGADDRQGDKNERPALKTPKTAEITYAGATGPLSMPMAQVRQTGIDVGVGQPNGRRFVYEFKICFTAGPSLSALGQGKTVGIGIETGKTDMNHEMRKPPEGGMDRKNHGGGMGGGGRPGGGSSAKAMGEPFETWIKVTLAGGSINPNARG